MRNKTMKKVATCDEDIVQCMQLCIYLMELGVLSVQFFIF